MFKKRLYLKVILFEQQIKSLYWKLKDQMICV